MQFANLCLVWVCFHSFCLEHSKFFRFIFCSIVFISGKFISILILIIASVPLVFISSEKLNNTCLRWRQCGAEAQPSSVFHPPVWQPNLPVPGAVLGTLFALPVLPLSRLGSGHSGSLAWECLKVMVRSPLIYHFYC